MLVAFLIKSNSSSRVLSMEVLERREIEDDKCNLPDVQKAWAEFQKYYNTESKDGKPLHDFDDEFNSRFVSEPAAEVASIKRANRGINRGIKSIISVAAVICIILVGSFTAKALGYDIWDAIIVWTKDTFGFETNMNEPEPTPYIKQIPAELAELENLMIEHGLSDDLIPGYIPDGYKILDLQYTDLADVDSIFCQLSNSVFQTLCKGGHCAYSFHFCGSASASRFRSSVINSRVRLIGRPAARRSSSKAKRISS